MNGITMNSLAQHLNSLMNRTEESQSDTNLLGINQSLKNT
jgi:hypothetical protein